MIAPDWFPVLAIAIGAAAALYAAVGHGGASAYLAIMALAGVAPDTMRPVALTLNLIVASIASWQFARVGAVDWRLFWTVAIPAVPLAWLGGRAALPPDAYRAAVGAVLIAAAILLIWKPRVEAATRPPSRTVAAGAGGALGLLAGLTGTGGGIFLSPLLVLGRWTDARTAAGVAALFVMVNSAAGLAGQGGRAVIPPETGWLAGAVLIGGWVGARAGARRFDRTMIVRVLALVLMIAGAKLLLR